MERRSRMESRLRFAGRVGRLLGVGVLALSPMVFAPGVRAQEDPGVSTGRVLADTGNAVKTAEGYYAETSIAAYCGVDSQRVSLLNYGQGYGIFLLPSEEPVQPDGFSHNIVVFAPIGLAPTTYSLSARYKCLDSNGNWTEMNGRSLEIELKHAPPESP